MSERKLHDAAFDFFNLVLPKDAIAFHPINEGRGGWKARAPERGGLPGLPDWLIIHQGKISAIELKSERGRISDAQMICHHRFKKAGVNVHVCRSLNEIDTALRIEKIPLASVRL